MNNPGHSYHGAQSSSASAVVGAANYVVEALERRTLLSGSVSGTLSHDLNGNGAFDPGEPGLSGWTVFLDQNRNRQRDAAETSTVTDALGRYGFASVPDGTYYVAQEVPAGWKQTYPTLNAPGVNESAGGAQRAADVAIHTTGSGTEVRVQGEVVEGVDPRPSDVQSNSLIRLTDFRADGRFTGIDGSGFSVAVLDTGIDLNHPFFGPDTDGNGVADRIVYHYDFADFDADASDVNGHGSHVASTIASGDATYSGMAPGADMIALKVFRNAGTAGSFSYVEKALQWVVANAETYNIAAINMSISDNFNWNTPQQRYGISDELAALAAKNVLVVSASGNDYYQYQAPGVGYPAADPNSLSVGAVYDANVGVNRGYTSRAYDYTTGPDRVTSFSQRSATMTDVFAPGADITHANQSGTTSTLTGTSMASPHVAGLAVLAQQLAVQELGRRLTLEEFRSLLQDTAATVFDGDDEDDNVPNVDADFARVDALRLGDAISKMATGEYYPLGHKVVVAGGDRAGLDFGANTHNPAPAAPVLTVGSDTGKSSTDGLTKLDNATPAKALKVRVSGVSKGMTVDLFADGTWIGSGVAEGSSILVTTKGSSEIADGARVLTARQRAAGVAASAASPGTTITIDSVAPAAPTALDLRDTSDTGLSNTDNITAASRPSFTFNLNGAPYFQFYRNGNRISWEYETTSSSYVPYHLGDGQASYAVGALDVAGNEAVSAPLLVTIDTAAAPGPTAPGTIDTSFGDGGGGDGASSPGPRDEATVVARQADGKIVVAGRGWNPTTRDMDILVARYNADGTPDTTFGAGGRTLVKVRDRSSAEAILIQPDGRIVVGGNAGFVDGSWYSPRTVLVRLTAAGARDTTFASAGVFMATTFPMTNNHELHKIARQPDGKLLLSFTAGSNGNWADFGVARLNVNGTLDTTFSSDGWATADFNNYPDEVHSMELLPDGKVLVMGHTTTLGSGKYHFAMMRFTATGALDTTFDGDGKLITDTATWLHSEDYWQPRSVLQPDGKTLLIMPAAHPTYANKTLPTVVRLNPDGTFDPTFGTDGKLPINGHFPSGITLQPDGKFLLAGWAAQQYRPGRSDAIRRFNADGTLDPLFGSGGVAHAYVWPEMNVNEMFRSVLVEPDGKIVGVGYTDWHYPKSERESRIAVARFHGGEAAVAPLDLQAASDTGLSSTDNITTDATPTFTLPDLHGGYARIYRDGTLLQGGYFNAPTWTAPAQAPGTSVYAIRFVDAAGNETGDVTLTVTVDNTAPTAEIVNVMPDPRDTAVDEISIVFSEPVTGFDLADLSLTRSGTVANLLSGASAVLSTSDNVTFVLTGIGTLTGPAGSYTLAFAGSTHGITDMFGRPLANLPSETWVKENDPPVVTDLFVAGSTWSASYLDFLGSSGQGDGTYGYRLDAAGHADELMWINLNKISVRFSDGVTLAPGALRIFGVNVPEYPGSVSYDPATFTATFTLASGVFTADKLLVHLDDAHITNGTGDALDGEWSNPAETNPVTSGGADTYPSGNGTAGGDFAIRLNVLPGDVNRDGRIVGNDVTSVRGNQGFIPGGAGYTIFRDVNGDGRIVGNDVTGVRSRQGIALPAGAPAAPAPALLAVKQMSDEPPQRGQRELLALRRGVAVMPFTTTPAARSVMRLLAQRFDLLGDELDEPLIVRQRLLFV